MQRHITMTKDNFISTQGFFKDLEVTIYDEY